MPIRVYIAFFCILIALTACGCDDENSPMKRKPLTEEQNTPEWRYSFNYSMFNHEYRVLSDSLETSRVRALSSWSRLREYLVSMKENLPADKSFEFLDIVNSFDSIMSTYINDRKPGSLVAMRLSTPYKQIERDYKPSKIYPKKEN